jgi:hypothetical protein
MVVLRGRLGVAVAILALEAFCWVMPVASVKGADMATKAPPAAAPQASDWQFEFDEDTRFYSWSGTRGFPATPTGPSGKGWQLFVPVSFDATGRTSPDSKWEFQVKSAYVWSN